MPLTKGRGLYNMSLELDLVLLKLHACGIATHRVSLQSLAMITVLSASVNFSVVPHASGIMQRSSFCDWLISLSTLFSGCTHVVAYCGISLFLRLSNIPCKNCICIPHFLYSFICQWTFKLFLHIGYYK